MEGNNIAEMLLEVLGAHIFSKRVHRIENVQARFGTILYTTLEVVRIAALLLQPVMPESAGKLLDLLGQSPEQRMFSAVPERLTPGLTLPAPSGVFPRYQP